MQECLIINHSAGFVGNSPQFWKRGGSGYTPWVDEAEVFTNEQADKTVASCLGSHRLQKVDKETVMALAKLTVDIQDLQDAGATRSDAVRRAQEMLSTPASELPDIALAFRDKMWGEHGMCMEVALTAFAAYAQCVEGLPCRDEAYLASPTAQQWFESQHQET